MALLDICIGVEEFREIRENNYCYVDKTSFIEEMLRTPPPKVSLITRPRRFGKTLTMTMLQEFFDIRQDSRSLFESLTVSRNSALCERWLNQYPTIFITLKGVEGQSFSHVLEKIALLIQKVCLKHAYLFDESKVPVELVENLVTLIMMMTLQKKKALQILHGLHRKQGVHCRHDRFKPGLIPALPVQILMIIVLDQLRVVPLRSGRC